MRIKTGRNKELQELVKSKLLELGYDPYYSKLDVDTIGYCTTELNAMYTYNESCLNVIDQNHDNLYGDWISIPDLLDIVPQKRLSDIKVGQSFKFKTNMASTHTLLSNENGLGKYKFMYYDNTTYILHGCDQNLNITII